MMTTRRPVIGVMGRGEGASAEDKALAETLGELVARERWILLTGGRDAGVMRAAVSGAKRVPESWTIGILPAASGEVCPGIDVAIFTGMGDARNVINVLSSDVVVICGSPGAGTASEAALAIKAGRPVLLLAAPNEAKRFFVSLSPSVLTAETALDAVQLIREELGRRPQRT